MILVSFFSEDNVLSDEIKICYIFEYKSNKNRAFCFLGGHPVYLIALGPRGSNGIRNKPYLSVLVSPPLPCMCQELWDRWGVLTVLSEIKKVHTHSICTWTIISDAKLSSFHTNIYWLTLMGKILNAIKKLIICLVEYLQSYIYFTTLLWWRYQNVFQITY